MSCTFISPSFFFSFFLGSQGIPLTARGTGGVEPVIAKSKTFVERKKERAKKRDGMVGLVIGGKLRGSEGMADIAFLEWLISKHK